MRANIYVISLILAWNAPRHVKGKKSVFEDMTVVEDVLGSFELKSLETLVANSTSKLAETVNRLAAQDTENAGDTEEWQREIEGKTLVLQESVDNVQGTLEDANGYIEEVYDGIKKNLISFKNNFMHQLSNLKLFVEHQVQTAAGQTSLASKQILASDCWDLYNLHYNASGAYWLHKYGLRVLCDMETEGGGWLVIQRRAKVDYQVDFGQGWFAYKMGFGDLDTEFWIGNDLLHILTNQKTYELRVEMTDFEKGAFYATYSTFRVGNETSNYALDIGAYSGNASDAFTYHHGRSFSTKDRDNDNYPQGNCATTFSGGWWYDRCYDAHLNGVYPDPPDRKKDSYVSWWMKEEEVKVPLVLTDVLIKIRPKMQ